MILGSCKINLFAPPFLTQATATEFQRRRDDKKLLCRIGLTPSYFVPKSLDKVFKSALPVSAALKWDQTNVCIVHLMPGCIVKESAVSSNLIRKFFFFIRVKAVCGSKAYLVDSSKLSRCVYIVAFYDASIC